MVQENFEVTEAKKEKEFHNHRIAFYLNTDNTIVFMKKRAISY